MRRAAIPCVLFLSAVTVPALAQDRNWQEVELRGLHVFGHATSTIAPCATGQPSWLDGSGPASRALHDAYEASVDAFLEPLYVVVCGKLDPDYDSGDYYLGWFVIEEFVEYSADPEVIADCIAEAAGK